MTRLAQWTVADLTALGAFHPVGSIEVATTDERWAELDRRWARARGFGLEARLLDPREVAELVPLLDPETIVGGLHVADDGIAKARARGRGDVPPRGDRGLRRLRGHGTADRGRPRRRRADGARDDPRRARRHRVRHLGARGVAAGARAQVPLVPVEHQLAYTAPLAELAGETREVVHPILRHQDHAMYFRQVADAYAIGNYRHEPRLGRSRERPG